MTDTAWRGSLRTITLYLLVPDARASMQFMSDVFGGSTVHETLDESGGVRHAQVAIGDSVVMLGESSPDFPAIPGAAYIYVDDVDATHARALSLGAEEIYPPGDQDYGDRCSGIRDPQGTCWWIGKALD